MKPSAIRVAYRHLAGVRRTVKPPRDLVRDAQRAALPVVRRFFNFLEDEGWDTDEEMIKDAIDSADFSDGLVDVLLPVVEHRYEWPESSTMMDNLQDAVIKVVQKEGRGSNIATDTIVDVIKDSDWRY